MYRIVTTAVPTSAEADVLSREAVERGLAACAQQRSIRSTYRWNGVLEQTDEVAIDFKTTTVRVDELVAFIEQRHSYDCPEIIVVPIESGSESYLAWLAQMTAQVTE